MFVLPERYNRASVLSFCAALLGACICYLVLNPAIGFDDANITLNYAENIAAGHGYVYVIGGERVEGSTSPLWTAINTLAYLLPLPPETFLAGLGFLVAWAIVWLSVRYAEHLFRLADAPAEAARILATAGFLCLPAFFGWVVWSLMDIGLWVLLTTCAFWISTLFLLTGSTGNRILLYALCCALMAAARPEGIAVVIGFSALLGALGGVFRMRHAILAGLAASLTAYAAITVFRLTYFGDVFPNTYYAKVSTDHISQMLQGLRYLAGFLYSPVNAGLVVLGLGVPLAIRTHPERRTILTFWGAAVLGLSGGMALYVLIGGDHFGSFRFFLFVYPVLIPLAALTAFRAWQALPGAFAHPVYAAMAGLALFLATTASFAFNKGHYAHELRIAEQGRAIGRILNGYPGQPSIGIVPAGGIAMTFDGQIYDLLGLNWVEMARADRSQAGRYVNHGGFSKTVFYRTMPDIVHPQIGECDKAAYDENAFFGAVLKGLFHEERFQELYVFECFDGLRFYRKTGLAGN